MDNVDYKNMVRLLRTEQSKHYQISISQIVLQFFEGDIVTALLYTQLLYWSDKGSNDWIYKTYAELEIETSLTKRKLSRAKDKLEIEYKFIETKIKNVNNKSVLHWKMNVEKALNDVAYFYANDYIEQQNNDNMPNESSNKTLHRSSNKTLLPTIAYNTVHRDMRFSKTQDHNLLFYENNPLLDEQFFGVLKKIKDYGIFKNKIPENIYKKPTRLIKRAEKFIKELLLRKLEDVYEFDEKWQISNKIAFKRLYKQIEVKGLENTVQTAIEAYMTMNLEGYWPANKKILVASIDTWFYNTHTQKSWFMFCVFNKPKNMSAVIQNKNYTLRAESLKKENPKVMDVILKLISDYSWASKNKYRTLSNTLEVYEWYKLNSDWINKHNPAWNGHCRNFQAFVNKWMEFATETFTNWTIGNFSTEGKTFPMFIKWIMGKYKLDISDKAKRKIKSRMARQEKLG